MVEHTALTLALLSLWICAVLSNEVQFLHPYGCCGYLGLYLLKEVGFLAIVKAQVCADACNNS